MWFHLAHFVGPVGVLCSLFCLAHRHPLLLLNHVYGYCGFPAGRENLQSWAWFCSFSIPAELPLPSEPASPFLSILPSSSCSQPSQHLPSFIILWTSCRARYFHGVLMSAEVFLTPDTYHFRLQLHVRFDMFSQRQGQGRGSVCVLQGEAAWCRWHLRAVTCLRLPVFKAILFLHEYFRK